MQNWTGHDERAAPDAGSAAAGRDARDQTADQRDRVADQRDQVADYRDGVADQREQQLAGWELRLDQRDRLLGTTGVFSVEDRGHQANTRARTTLSSSMAALDRSDAALRRAAESHIREQDLIDREVAASVRGWAGAHGDAPTASTLADSAEQLRMLLVATARELAKTVDLVARHHDELASENPDEADEHRGHADDARATAELARETAQRFSD